MSATRSGALYIHILVGSDFPHHLLSYWFMHIPQNCSCHYSCVKTWLPANSVILGDLNPLFPHDKVKSCRRNSREKITDVGCKINGCQKKIKMKK
jgi:hypothetical protein